LTYVLLIHTVFISALTCLNCSDTDKGWAQAPKPWGFGAWAKNTFELHYIWSVGFKKII